jgi:hypothetical protein
MKAESIVGHELEVFINSFAYTCFTVSADIFISACSSVQTSVF